MVPFSRTELISFSKYCKSNLKDLILDRYPQTVVSATGSFVHNSAIICGGYDTRNHTYQIHQQCYKLRFDANLNYDTLGWISICKMKSNERLGARSSIVGSDLWITGGCGFGTCSKVGT